MHLFVILLVIGFVISIPIGPVGLLCIHLTLHRGWRTGLAAGLGAAAADGLFSLIAGSGTSAFKIFLTGKLHWVQLIGIALLFVFGVRYALSSRVPDDCDERKETSVTGLYTAFASTLGLTLANPANILAIAAIFLGLEAHGFPHIGPTSHLMDASTAVRLVGGVFLGAALWRVLLTAIIARLRHSLDPAVLRFLNHICGYALIVFSLVLLVRFFLHS